MTTIPSAARAPSGAPAPGARIVLFTFGTLGDLHPALAIARGLIARGHRAELATSATYREKVEVEGVCFRPVRPDIANTPEQTHTLMRRLMHPARGSERVIREMIMAPLRESWEDTLTAARGADLLVGHPITFAVPIVAETLSIPWISTVLAPMSFFSCHDPAVPPNAPWLEHLRGLGPGFHHGLKRIVRRVTLPWVEPVARLRAEAGLLPGVHPLFDGQHSPLRVLALFSGVMGEPQPDWPPATIVTGFPFLDHPGDYSLPPALAAFLEAGPEPLVFTLGTSAVYDAGTFYIEAAGAAERLGARAVLLVGRETLNRLPTNLPAGVIAVDYAPFAALFPRAAAIVHQGGVGTTAEALRSGRPMLVVPFSHDQFDNAARVARLGVARRLDRKRFTAARVAVELRRLLADSGVAERSREVGRRVRAEDGVSAACDAIEAALPAPTVQSSGARK